MDAQEEKTVKTICVAGSLNVDLTISLPRFHQPGETITGTSFCTYTGGKGGNQAIAAARLGAQVMMTACVGRDSHGDMYLETLAREGVDTSCVRRAEEEATGVALIEVDASGENRIAIAPGANACVDRAWIDRCEEDMARCGCCLLQLEIPMDTVLHTAERMHRRGVTVILDPAPAVPLPDELCRYVDLLTPNETELALLTGMSAGTDDQVLEAARTLLARGVKAVAAKLGSRGCMYVDQERVIRAEGFRVDAVDTTAAGDSFNAGLAVGLAQGLPMAEALRLANAVGALSTTGFGAQGAMPAMAQAKELMRR
ncbi:MAG: ribokinase [Clostridia bacterium]|nr:ribokinase [Clostridia bacterium]